MVRNADAALARRAASQHGVFTRTHAVELGFAPGAIEHRVRSGRWAAVSESVFVIAGSPSTFAQQLTAATFAVPGAVASHEAAARLHGFEPAFRPRTVVTVGSHATRRIAGALVHRTNRMPEHHVVWLGPIAVTSPVRTILDLAAVIKPGRLQRVVDEQIASRRVVLSELVDEFEAHATRGRRGMGRLRPVLAERSGDQVVPPSVLEARFAGLVADAGLPRGVAQYRPPWGGSLIGRVDVGYLDHRLVVELDGRTWHSRDEAFETDRRRDQLAAMEGWVVLRFTWNQVVHRSDEVIQTLLTVLERRSP